MNLQIRNREVRELAAQVASRDGISLTDAVLKALKAEVARGQERETMEETVHRLHKELFGNVKPAGRLMTKEEIDDMWGHSPDNE